MPSFAGGNYANGILFLFSMMCMYIKCSYVIIKGCIGINNCNYAHWVYTEGKCVINGSVGDAEQRLCGHLSVVTMTMGSQTLTYYGASFSAASYSLIVLGNELKYA